MEEENHASTSAPASASEVYPADRKRQPQARGPSTPTSPTSAKAKDRSPRSSHSGGVDSGQIASGNPISRPKSDDADSPPAYSLERTATMISRAIEHANGSGSAVGMRMSGSSVAESNSNGGDAAGAGPSTRRESHVMEDMSGRRREDEHDTNHAAGSPSAPVSGSPLSQSKAVVISQPTPKPAMSESISFRGNRNARRKPVDNRGNRSWSVGLCGCLGKGESQWGTWCLALWCPCIVYGRNKVRFDYLLNHDSPEPREVPACNGGCAVHGIMMTLFGLGLVLQVPFRSTIRSRYSISGSCCGDCFTALFCYSCELTQEHIEISTEENSFPRGIGGSSGKYCEGGILEQNHM